MIFHNKRVKNNVYANNDQKSVFYTWENEFMCPFCERTVQFVSCWGYRGMRWEQERRRSRRRIEMKRTRFNECIVEREKEREANTKRIPHAIICIMPCLRRPRYFISIRHYFFASLCALLTRDSRKRRQCLYDFLKNTESHTAILLNYAIWKIGIDT